MKQYQWQTWALKTLKKQSKFKALKKLESTYSFQVEIFKNMSQSEKDFILFLFLLSLEEIVDTRGLDSCKRNMEENILSTVRASIEDDE